MISRSRLPLTLLAAAALATGCATTPAAAPTDAAPTGATTSAATTTPTTATTSGDTAAPAGTVTCTYLPSGSPARAVDLPDGQAVPASGTSTVTLSLGGQPLTLTLDRAAAPCAVASFESLAAQGYYEGTSCHRLVTQGIFVLQCGDPSGTGRGGPGYTFADELDAIPRDAAGYGEYTAGTLAMANAGANTNGSQFFIVYEDSTLPPAYTIFGHLDQASVDVVANIAEQGHDAARGAGDGVPNAPTEITSVVSG
ncbi:peptidylprolyl isomerase [Propioniciclava soli]|uniref:peptidylprolyl isomerase n=1 Tax=Propioniciclava soli TaxID=2775081 RepID=UPI001E4AABDE